MTSQDSLDDKIKFSYTQYTGDVNTLLHKDKFVDYLMKAGFTITRDEGLQEFTKAFNKDEITYKEFKDVILTNVNDTGLPNDYMIGLAFNWMTNDKPTLIDDTRLIKFITNMYGSDKIKDIKDHLLKLGNVQSLGNITLDIFKLIIEKQLKSP